MALDEKTERLLNALIAAEAAHDTADKAYDDAADELNRAMQAKIDARGAWDGHQRELVTAIHIKRMAENGVHVHVHTDKQAAYDQATTDREQATVREREAEQALIDAKAAELVKREDAINAARQAAEAGYVNPRAG